ncbi:peptidoglycan-binding protein [Candidatus Nomurabacteria bacterium]|nr:peptidoglycan-binding protein [Candidatus Nomurabacteria bacterium]
MKIKIGFLLAVLFFTSVGFVHAADLNFTNNTNINIGANTYVITAGSVATSPMTLSATTLTVTVPAGTFTLQSANGFALGTTGSLPQSCNGGTNQVIITGVAGPIVITPNTGSVVCPSSGSVTSSGSGGLVSSAPLPPPVVTPLPATTPPPTATTPPVTTPTTPVTTPTGSTSQPTVASPVTYNLGTTTLKNGSTGNAVKELQRFLNSDLKANIAVDGKLGPKTIAIIKKWQKAHKLTPDGLIGAKTKKLMNSLAK